MGKFEYVRKLGVPHQNEVEHTASLDGCVTL